MCVPVLNNDVLIYRSIDSERVGTVNSVTQAADVKTPGRVLAKANTCTLLHHLRDWAVLMPGGPGPAVSADGDLKNVVDHLHWPSLITTKDNLVVNDCVTRLLEDAIQQRRTRDGASRSDMDFTHLPVSCCCHSAVLSMKPLIKNGCGDLSTAIVRLGHIRESLKVSEQFGRAISGIVDDSFRYRMVPFFTPSMLRHQARNRRILTRTRQDHNLTVEQEELLLHADNGDWESDLIFHYCLPDCPLGCRGNEDTCKMHVRVMARERLMVEVIVLLILILRRRHHRRRDHDIHSITFHNYAFESKVRVMWGRPAAMHWIGHPMLGLFAGMGP